MSPSPTFSVHTKLNYLGLAEMDFTIYLTVNKRNEGLFVGG